MNLKEQLDHLDRVLLTTVSTAFPNPLTDEEKAATNAYLVLAHAVLEETLESAFERHFRRLASWCSSDMIPFETARLLFAMREWLPESHVSTFKRRDLIGTIRAAEKPYLSSVRANNGLKPNNVEHLAQTVGLDWVRFETTLNSQLEDLRTLGTKRGDAGHLSPYTEKAVVLSRQDYPDNVREWVYAGRDAVIAIASYLSLLVDEQQPLSLISDWDGN